MHWHIALALSATVAVLHRRLPLSLPLYSLSLWVRYSFSMLAVADGHTVTMAVPHTTHHTVVLPRCRLLAVACLQQGATVIMACRVLVSQQPRGDHV